MESEQEAVPLSEEELPLVLPDTDDFKPSGTPESPLANVSHWLHYTHPDTGLPPMHCTTTTRSQASSLVQGVSTL